MHLILAICTLALGAWPNVPVQGALGQSFTVSSGPSIIEIDEILGDRMFMRLHASYDSRTFRLLSAEERGSCCGDTFTASVSGNDDGTYAIESSSAGAYQFVENLPKYAASTGPVLIGSLELIPWIEHVSHARSVTQLNFFPFATQTVSVHPRKAGELEIVTSFAQGNATRQLIVYDPCTFVVRSIERLDEEGAM